MYYLYTKFSVNPGRALRAAMAAFTAAWPNVALDLRGQHLTIEAEAHDFVTSEELAAVFNAVETFGLAQATAAFVIEVAGTTEFADYLGQHYIGQPAAVQQLLTANWQAALATLATRFARARQAATEATTAICRIKLN